MKPSNDAAAIADLLLSEQPNTTALALVLLEQVPVYRAVLPELLAVYLTTQEEALQQDMFDRIRTHAPAPLADALYDNRLLVRNFHQINDNFRGSLYERLERDGQLTDVGHLATLVYQRTGNGLDYLIHKLDATALEAVLAPRWDAVQRRLDLSSAELRAFPHPALRLFEPVERLDLRYNGWLYPIKPAYLEPFPHLKIIQLDGSVWRDSQLEMIGTLLAAFPNLELQF